MRLRKLYVDCVCDDASVCIAYVSELSAFGARIQPAGIEHYDADGGHVVRRGRARLSLADEPDVAALSEIAWVFDARTCVVHVEPEYGARSPAVVGSLTVPGMSWSVKVARARVRISDLRSEGDELVGTGYADWVELTRTPRTLGLLQLDWGRIHLEGGSVIYSLIERSDDVALRSAAFWPSGGTPQPIENFRIERDVATGVWRIRASVLDRRADIELTAVRPLHQGAAVDGARFPSWIERAVSRVVAGPTHERRWLSRARCDVLGAGFAVHESVRFGARAKDTSP